MKCFLIACLCAIAFGVSAQDSGGSVQPTEEGTTEDDYQSGYGDIPEFGGPDGVSSELARNDRKRESTYDFDGAQRLFAPYFDWKRRLKDDHGLSLGFQYYLLPQLATSSRDDKNALGSIFRFQGSWTFSTGVEITRRFDEIWTIGAGWARPSEMTHGPGLRDEWVIETSYKFQLSKNFSMTPDVQVLFNPANNPGKSSIWVAGVRAILTL